MAGYSSTPLAKKLGIKAHYKVKLVNAPDYYFDLFNDLPEIELTNNKNVKKDFIHLFVKSLMSLSLPLKMQSRKLK